MLKFDIGKLVCTSIIFDWAMDDLNNNDALMACIARHHKGDWGDVPAEDKVTNDEALLLGNRLVSKYTLGCGDIYIITEWDRSITTVMLCEEY